MRRPHPTPQPVARHPRAATESDTPARQEPTFIVGAQRSGTTLLRLMLAGHPDLTVVSEFEYVVDALSQRRGGLTTAEILQSVGQPLPDGDVLRRRVAKDWIFDSHGFVCDPHLDYRNLAHSFLHQARLRAGNENGKLLAMVHHDISHLPRLWPWARFIHIVRDPRDVARSCIGMGWAGNVYHGVARWIQVEREWAELREALPKDRYIEIRQEDLILDPSRTLGKACEFLGVRWHHGLLSYQQTTTYGAPDPKLVEQWRHALSAREIGVIEGRVGRLLPARGYRPSGHRVRKPGPIARIALRLDDKIRRIRFRIQTLGLQLWLAEVLARNLGLAGLRQRIEPKLHENWKSRLK